MFNQNGLSLDQAPPISVVFRFFFLGSLFGIFGGFLLFIYQTTIFNAETTGALTFTHVLTLGVMLSFMFAALFQMLPVIAGVTLTSPSKKANLLLYPFTLGIVTLLLGFNFPHYTWLFIVSAFLLSIAILTAIVPMLTKLLAVKSHTPSSKGMVFALLSLGFVVLLALYLLGTLSGILEGSHYIQVKTSHYSFGLFAWISLLIISISFQVIEMFYVTPPYPESVSRYLPLTLFLVVMLTTVIGFFIPQIWLITDLILALLLGAYALLTLKRLTQKKRPLTDATVWFWRLGLSLLVLSMLCMTMGGFTNVPFVKPLSYIFFSFFALSIVFAMFYKIVPFLTWFHLNSQGYFTAPMMHEVIHPKTAKKHLYIHLGALVIFVLSLFIPSVIFIAALLMILSFGWIAWQIIHAWKLYNKTQETGEKFDMGSMS
ncbi:MAG TPA: hypothetical protein ENK39_09795 [Epsilonproteobacteria bacterium]|nr:hypothetical protein [Campylobacterota bacterium]